MVQDSFIKVIHKETKETLFQCSYEESEKAYDFARQMEELGVDIEVLIPGAPVSLAQELGASQEHVQELKDFMEEEIKSHVPDTV